jgi:peptidoglycan/LPS O-acetylase OafA/YrhL
MTCMLALVMVLLAAIAAWRLFERHYQRKAWRDAHQEALRYMRRQYW